MYLIKYVDITMILKGLTNGDFTKSNILLLIMVYGNNRRDRKVQLIQKMTLLYSQGRLYALH